MLGIKRIDHVSVVTGDLSDRIQFYKDLFAMEVVDRFETPEGGFKGVAMSIPGSPTRWEILEPLGDDSFLRQFLAGRGPGMHHVTYEVEDADKAAAALRAYGIEPFNEQTSHGWHQMFLHPKDTGGVLIQLYEVVPED